MTQISYFEILAKKLVNFVVIGTGHYTEESMDSKSVQHCVICKTAENFRKRKDKIYKS